MNVKVVSAVVIILLAVGGIGAAFALTGNGPGNGNQDEGAGPAPTNTYLDMSDNEVTMPEEIRSIAVIGVGSLRVFSHLGLADKICSSDQLAKGATYGSNTYMYAFDELWNKDVVKLHSGARQAVNAEAILACNNGERPDVLAIVDTLAQSDANRNAIDTVKAAGVTVFEIKSVQELMTADGKISPLYEKQLTRIGAAFGVSERATALINGVNAILEDVKSLAGTGNDKLAYVGGLTVSSARGLNLTSPAYPPFILAGTSNIVREGSAALDAGGTEAGTSVNVEALCSIIEEAAEFDMFVDPAGWRLQNGLCTGDDIIATTLYNKGVTSGVVVTPFHSYGMEYDNILVNCYLVAQSLYDLDSAMIREKIDAVYELYYGSAAVNTDGVKLYDEMGAWYYENTKCFFGETVTFNADGSITMTDGETVLSKA